MNVSARRSFRLKAAVGITSTAIAAILLFLGGASAHHRNVNAGGSNSAPRFTQDLTGSVPTHDGERVRLSTELGSIAIHEQDTDKLDYRIHLETDGSQKGAQQLLKSFAVSVKQTPDGVSLRAESPGRHWTGRLWATLELTIPKNVSLEVSTGGGNIGAKSVAGELNAATGGGHIVIGSIAGNATLHTSGGHIRVASIQGTARLETGGGNITLGHSGADMLASTEGGEIQVGEAAGLVRAKTGGGGIRVVRMVGPTDLETGGGSIYLTQVDSPVRASTSSGGITAWFVGPAKAAGTCDLQSSDGDIIVHLPRQLPITIDAQVENGDEHRVIVDPAFPLKVSYDDSSKAHAVRAEGALNGGGELLRLRTLAGNIRFVLSDADKQLELYKQQMAQLQKQTEELQKQLMKQGLTLN